MNHAKFQSLVQALFQKLVFYRKFVFALKIMLLETFCKQFFKILIHIQEVRNYQRFQSQRNNSQNRLEILQKYQNYSKNMIELQGQIFCPKCNLEYKDNNLPRILTMCGHTYCESCIQKMIFKNISSQQADNGHPFIIECPQQGALMRLKGKEGKVFPKNLALIKVIEAKKANMSFRDQSFNLSKIGKQQQAHQDDETTDIISAINQCKQNINQFEPKRQFEQLKQIKVDLKQKETNEKKHQKKKQQKNTQNKEDEELCLLHQKPLQIVCIIDQKKICSKCAIFGQHKGHEFKTIEQVQKQKNQRYIEILQIFKEKEDVEQRMSNKDTKMGLIQILDKKRDLLQKQVREQFRKLREEITKQQKLVLKKLQQTYKATEKRITGLLKIDEKTINDFSNWEVQSYTLLKVLESSELEPKINALYSKDKRNQKTLLAGKQILGKIKEQEKNLVTKVQQILIDLQCKKSKQIYELLPGFLQISEKKEMNLQKPVSSFSQKQYLATENNILLQSEQKQKESNPRASIIYEFNKKGTSIEVSPLLEQSLLQDEEQQVPNYKTEQKVNNFYSEMQLRLPLMPNENILNKNSEYDSVSCSFIKLEVDSAKKIAPRTALKGFNDEVSDFMINSRCSSILTSRTSLVSRKQNGQRPNKKKLKSIKISEKYQKILEGIYNNTVQTIDLTNAEVGDQAMIQICQFVKFSKARTIKFIRNKLTDSGVEKILPSLSNAQILNLSQNNLTEGVIDIFIKHRYGCLSGLKNLILSQNKINERKHKSKIDQLRAMNIVVSV